MFCKHLQARRGVKKLPCDFPKWQLVYYYFSRWNADGTFEEIHETLRDRYRAQQNNHRSPIITDTNGLLLAVEIPATNENDGKAGFRVIKSLFGRFERMQKIYADGGYRGELEENIKNDLGWDMEITLRSDKSNGFKPLPKRWVVKRTFSWLENFRGLAKDYEYKVSTSEAMIHLGFIALMFNRIYSQ
jgi:putative transposase